MSVATADSFDEISEIVPDDDADDAGAEGPEEEEEEEEELFVKDADNPCIVWCGPNKKYPILIFSSLAVERRDPLVRSIGEKYHMAFKFVKGDCKLLKSILVAHGFHETHPNSPDFNLVWTNSHLKPYVLRSLTEFQKVNHFPRSYELTRKDRLYKNVQRLQQMKGIKHFDFVPPSFVFPAEFQEFCSYYLKDKGPFIVKPIASSQGRGIFIVSHPDQIPLDDQLIVCKYIANPLVVDGFKFDLRIYVAVTSYDPLIVYMYEEGLARFATVKYQAGSKYIRNQCMHLTNYSVNKRNNEFVQNDDAEVEDYGNKWSLGALLRYLKSEGHDTSALMMRLEDVIVKSILSVEMPIATACKMFQPHRGNCFELYGFDIIVDETLRPWLLEVNLSPSLGCDSPLDFKIKCNMLSDLFSLVGFVCHDPMLRSLQGRAREQTLSATRSRLPSCPSVRNSRPSSASSMRSRASQQQQQKQQQQQQQQQGANGPALSVEEIRMVRRAREEFQRRGGWLRIFPTPDSWDAYGGFLQTQNPNNLVLHQRLFPASWRGAKATLSLAAVASKSKVPLHSLSSGSLSSMLDSHAEHHRRVHQLYRSASQRTLFYERKLGTAVRRSKHQQQQQQQQQQQHRGSSRSSSVPAAVRRQPSFGPHAAKRGGQPLPPEPLEPDDDDKEAASAASAASADGDAPASATTETATEPTDSSKKQRREAAGRPPPKPRPPTPPPEPTPPPPASVVAFDADSVLRSAGRMTKVQARQAFAAYLVRVQRRLLADQEQREPLSDADQRLANEQLDLVLRFLKRASAKVAPPSRKLPLQQRQRLLANMLAEFVRAYDRETDAMRPKASAASSASASSSSASASADGVEEAAFVEFLRSAEESQLESLLTAYTRVNKSTGVFISGSSGGGGGGGSSSSKRRDSQQSDSGGGGGGSSSKRRDSQQSETGGASVSGSVNGGGGGGGSSSAGSSYRAAVSVYSASPLKRPSSAAGGHLSRPAATRFGANSSGGGGGGGLKSLATYDESALNEALQRLAVRQQSRQYAAYRVSCSTLSRPGSAEPPQQQQQQQQQGQQQQQQQGQQQLLSQLRQSRALLDASRSKHDSRLQQQQQQQTAAAGSGDQKPPRPARRD